ncbi:MAG: PEP-CTERM sorting domain-containing protein [Betaproteobacteria bacterium]|nr:PEP-CTERM sorting domain-containing protein [Betaproteobacteria bacterium]
MSGWRLGIAVLGCFAALSGHNANAMLITTNYAGLGSLYQDAGGVLYSSAGTGRVDVTALVQRNIETAITYWQNAILLPWNETINFSTANLSGAVADSLITATDADNRPSTSNIRLSIKSTLSYFIDPTPTVNDEFVMFAQAVNLGGSLINLERFGNADSNGPAVGRYDMLTLMLHELEHSIGVSSSLPRFINLVGATGTPGRKLTIPSALSGAPNSFDVPFVSDSAHIDGSTQSGFWNLTELADPGWSVGQRVLPSAVDILSVCVVEGCTAAQMNTNPQVPEPGSLALSLAAVVACAIVVLRRRRR